MFVHVQGIHLQRMSSVTTQKDSCWYTTKGCGWLAIEVNEKAACVDSEQHQMNREMISKAKSWGFTQNRESTTKENLWSSKQEIPRKHPIKAILDLPSRKYLERTEGRCEEWHWPAESLWAICGVSLCCLKLMPDRNPPPLTGVIEMFVQMILLALIISCFDISCDPRPLCFPKSWTSVFCNKKGEKKPQPPWSKINTRSWPICHQRHVSLRNCQFSCRTVTFSVAAQFFSSFLITWTCWIYMVTHSACSVD